MGRGSRAVGPSTHFVVLLEGQVSSAPRKPSPSPTPSAGARGHSLRARLWAGCSVRAGAAVSRTPASLHPS